jgi:hypothetical protein
VAAYLHYAMLMICELIPALSGSPREINKLSCADVFRAARNSGAYPPFLWHLCYRPGLKDVLAGQKDKH